MMDKDSGREEECCGTHAICEMDSLLFQQNEIHYFGDEDLDELSGENSLNFSSAQISRLNEVFLSLSEKDVAPWLRSLQQRNIQLPIAIREMALMIVSERRS